MSRRQQLFKLARRSLATLIDLLLSLEAQVRQLRRQVKELKDRLALTSRNSSKPPSTDGLAKLPAQSLRAKTTRRPGGQPGHPGRTLQPVAKPDHIRVHSLDRCPCGHCHGHPLRQQPVLSYEKRQVFELPQKPLEVTEHQAEIKCCPISGRLVRATFPAAVNAPVQYGPRFQAALVYFHQEHALPLDRLTQICQDLYGQPLSQATVLSANQRTYEKLEPFEQALVWLLPQEPLVHLDESGLRVAGQLHWLHVASNHRLTFYGVHPRRGTEAINFFDIVPRCRAWVVHDHLKAYFTYDQCLHALCNQHHLRELKFVYEQDKQSWAQELSRFLLHCNERRKQNGVLGEKAFKGVLAHYHAILAKGRKRHPGRSCGAQSKAANLLDRLEGFDLCVLAFLFDPEVPFTNNQAEQDIRMVKVRQKISGCFRTLRGARVFARIRSYISTCRKQDRNILDALHDAILGQAFIPAVPARGP